MKGGRKNVKEEHSKEIPVRRTKARMEMAKRREGQSRAHLVYSHTEMLSAVSTDHHKDDADTVCGRGGERKGHAS